MPDTPQIDDPVIDPLLETYNSDLEALTLLALAGDIDEDDFREELLALVLLALRTAFLLAGGSLDDPASVATLEEVLNQHRQSVDILTDDIYSGKYNERSEEDASKGNPEQTGEEGEEKLLNRLVLWVFAVAAAYDTGKQHGRRTEIRDGQIVLLTETWHVGATEHCTTCLGLDGATLTIDEWDQLGLWPRHPDLECGGWKCGCGKFAEGLPSDGLAVVAARIGV